MRKRLEERQWDNEIKKRENERLKVWGCRGGRNRAIPLNQV